MAFLVTSLYGAKPLRKAVPKLNGYLKNRISTLPEFLGHNSFESALKFYKVRSVFVEPLALSVMKRQDLADNFLFNSKIHKALLQNISEVYGPYGVKAVIDTKDKWVYFIKEDGKPGAALNSSTKSNEPLFTISVKQMEIEPTNIKDIRRDTMEAQWLSPMPRPVARLVTYEIFHATGNPPEGEIIAYSKQRDDVYDCLKNACMDESVGSAYQNFNSFEAEGFYLVKKSS